MNIWFLSSEYPPHAGGIATYVQNMSQLLAQAGHKVTILTIDQQEACEERTPEGVRIIRFVPRCYQSSSVASSEEPDEHPAFPFNVMSYWPALSYQFAEELISRLSEEPELPDIIECQDYGAIAYFMLQRRLIEETVLAKVPVLIHLHGPTFEIYKAGQLPRYKFPHYWVGQMEKFCIVAADGLLSPSHFLKHRICHAVERDLPIEVIPYPYQLEDLMSSQPSAWGDIVCVGRLQVWKGTLHVVKACAHLWDQGYDFRLTLIGGDTEFAPRGTTVKSFLMKKYQRFIREGRLVITKGPLPRSELYQRMAKAWAVVIPSLWDNFPNVCIEAMALGKLVIASTSGGQAEIVGSDGRCGLLFDWAKPGDFERVLKQALAMSGEENQRIGAQAAKRIRELTAPAKIIPQRVAHYEAVIQNYKVTWPPRLFPTTFAVKRHEAADKPTETDQGESVKGLLSVVIPFYNLGPYLQDTLDSILASTYQPIEVIIVNDASDDPESLRVLREIERRADPIIRIVHHSENQGLASARNTGALAARGEFLAFVDADDMVEPDFFPQAIKILRRYENVDFVYSWQRYFGDTKGCWINWNAEFPYLLGHNMCSVIVVIKRARWLAHGMNRPEVEYALEDYDSWIRMVSAGCVGVSIPKFLTRYRVRRESMLRQMNHDQALYLYDLISHYNKEAYQQYGVELFNLQNANGPGHLWPQPACEWETPAAVSQHLQEQLRVKDQELTNLRALLQARERELAETQQTLMAMQNTLAWKLLQRYWRWTDRLLPPGTRRRQWHSRMLGAARVVLNEGWRGLGRRLKEKMPKKRQKNEGISLQSGKAEQEAEGDGKPRVLVLVPAMDAGGMERCTEILLRHFNRESLKLDLAMIFDRKPFYPVPDGIKTYILERYHQPQPHGEVLLEELPPLLVAQYRDDLIWLEATAQKLSVLVQKLRPDALLAQDFFATLIALLAKKYIPAHIKVLGSAHIQYSGFTQIIEKGELYSTLIRRYFNKADQIIAVSEGIATDLTENFGIRPEIMTVIHNPLDLAQIKSLAQEPVREHSWFHEGVPIFLFVGRLTPQKGLPYLLQAMTFVCQREPARCVIVGDGPQRQELEKLAHQLQISDSVAFLGQQNNPFKFMRRATSFVLPSVVEGMPYVIAEAMACGCPVIATDCAPGVRELLGESQRGLLVPPKDPTTLAEAMLKILQGAEFRERLSHSGLEFVKRFSAEKVAAEYEAIILKAIKGQ